jgi:DNA-binding IclR family transcriptional regulator
VVTSMTKGLQILNFIASSSEPVTVRGLARGTGLSKSTAHRLASELCDWGALDIEPEGYRLGLRLFELGGIALRHNRLEHIARPHMEDLFETTRRLTQLGVLQGTDVIYLARVGRQGHQRVASPVAGRVPATCTALGKALLAYSPSVLAAALGEGLPRLTKYTITDPNVFRNQLSHIRLSGIATEREETRVGLCCVASPIVIDSRAQAALSLTGPVEMFDPDDAGHAVRRAALRLSRALTQCQGAQRYDPKP